MRGADGSSITGILAARIDEIQTRGTGELAPVCRWRADAAVTHHAAFARPAKVGGGHEVFVQVKSVAPIA